MNSSTTSPLGEDIPHQFAQQLLDAINESTKQAYRLFWTAIKQKLIEHWFLLIVGLVLLVALAVIKYRLTGRWGMLASVLYNYLYFGTLFVVTLIFGPEIFANEYIDLVFVIIYIVCFTLVGIFVNVTGIRKQWHSLEYKRKRGW
jgi:hypothetical protein